MNPPFLDKYGQHCSYMFSQKVISRLCSGSVVIPTSILPAHTPVQAESTFELDVQGPEVLTLGRLLDDLNSGWPTELPGASLKFD